MIEDTVPPFIIRLDFSTPLKYENWVEEILYADLEDTGPATIDLLRVERYLHPKQRRGVVRGEILHEHLKKTHRLERALGLRAGREILKKNFWPEPWKGQAIFLWKGIVKYRNAGLRVPCVLGSRRGMAPAWYWLDSDFGIDAPAGLYGEH